MTMKMFIHDYMLSTILFANWKVVNFYVETGQYSMVAHRESLFADLTGFLTFDVAYWTALHAVFLSKQEVVWSLAEALSNKG